MTQLEALRGLARKVEDDVALSNDFNLFVTPYDEDSVATRNYAYQAYNGSLDAAKRLHDAVLPGWSVNLCFWTDAQEWQIALHSPDGQSGREAASKDNPARAWLLAIIRAKISELETERKDDE